MAVNFDHLIPFDLKLLRGMANNADPDQTAPQGTNSLIWGCTVYIWQFVRKFVV